MNSYDKGRYADLLLNHLRTGVAFNDNQAEMLIALGTNVNRSNEDIETALRVVISKNPPRHCVLPEVAE